MNWITSLIKELLLFLRDIALLDLTHSESEEMEYIPVVPETLKQPEVPQPVVKTPREILYETAKNSLGMDASPRDIAPDEYGCAETVNEIHKQALGFYIATPGISTLQLYKAMLANPAHFQKVVSPLPGDIIISPTTLGNGRIPNGHVGIVAKYGILSNDSATGLFKENYTLEKWMQYYQFRGGYPVYFFRCI